MLIRRLLLAALALSTALVAAFVFAPDPQPGGDSTRARLSSSPLPIVAAEIELSDDTRATPANRDFPGAPTRSLPTLLWYPAGVSDPLPLIVFSHGFSAHPRGGEYLAEHLAERGYLVAAAVYPLTHFGAPGDPTLLDVVNQPGDVSFILDELLARSSSRELSIAIDANRIGVAGVSLGAMTSLLVGFHPRLADSRIAAVATLAPPLSPFTSGYFDRRPLPLLMITAGQDGVLPPATHGNRAAALASYARVFDLAGGSHIGFSGPARWMRALSRPDDLTCYFVKGNVDASQQSAFFTALGSTTDGINTNAANDICASALDGPIVDPRLQQAATRAAVGAFFDSLFATSPATRADAEGYLRRSFAAEFDFVTDRSAYHAGR